MPILDPVLNFAKTTVSTGYDDAALSIVLSSGHGALLPQPSTDGAFNLVWWNSTDYPDPSDDPNKEIVRCTARSTDTLTITRSQESTSASTKNTSAKTYKMILSMTKKMKDDIESAQKMTYYKVTQSSHSFSAGDVIRNSGAANTYTKSQADSAANAEVVGIVVDVFDSNNFTYVTEGIFTSGVPTNTAGTAYFLDPSTAGALTATEPSTIGQISKPLLIVLESATKAFFHNYRGMEITATETTPYSVTIGGTGVSTLGDAGVLIGNGTGAVQVTGAGNVGEVLTSNGAGVAPTFQAAGGGTPTAMIATSFETAARFSTAVNGGGSATFNGPQAEINTSSTSTSSAKITWVPVNFQNISLYNGSPTFSVIIASNGLTAASGAGSSFFGIGAPTVDGSGHTYTVPHIGFKVIKAAGVVSVYGTQANGTETATAALIAIVDNDAIDLIFKVNGSTSVDYYTRKNGGALSSATNLATNQPTGVQPTISFSTSNDATGFQYKFQIGSASYSR